MKLSKQNKNIIKAFAGIMLLAGAYNAFVINSDSKLSHSDVGYSKRLDEVYGVTTPGRQVAGEAHWKKIEVSKTQEIQKIAKSEIVKVETPSVPEQTSEAAINDELSLNLVEVINPVKWKDGIQPTDFNGSITTNNGVIESLTVSLPGTESVSVSFAEMTGNVFEYEISGQIQTGMMYQVDQNAYMITLNSGPLEGTRLRFSGEAPSVEQEQAQEILAENQIEIGNFGQEPAMIQPEIMAENEVQNTQTADMGSQGFAL